MLDFLILQVTGDPGEAELTAIELLFKGGVLVIPILLLSVISIYIMVERFIEIFKLTRINDSLLFRYNELISQGNTVEARKLMATSEGSMNTIMVHAADQVGKAQAEMESAIELVSQTELNKMNRNLNYLGLIAGIAPMLGFVGTIMGVIKIFYNISITDNISIGIISEGLYMKMISSGLGLTVGIIAFTGYHILVGMVSRFTARVEKECLDFFRLTGRKG